MERDSNLYKIRRFFQKVAFFVLPKKMLSKIYYKIVTGKKLNLKNPQTLNEKVQWLKLNYFSKSSLVIKCTDKYLVRNHIIDKGYPNKLTNLLGVWENAKDIPWDSLPERFVLKCNHGCAYNLICTDKETFDKKGAVKTLNKWLKEDFSKFNVELHYGKIKKHLIICEEFLGENLIDYKFFCFNGEPKFYYVSSDLIHDRQAKLGFFYMNGEKILMIRDDYEDIGQIEKPFFFDEMVKMAKNLSKDFPFVRVDYFLTVNDFKFAELTFTPGAGMMPFNPPHFDLDFGKLLDIDYLQKSEKK